MRGGAPRRMTHWWRSRFSRLRFSELKLRTSSIFDFATSITCRAQPLGYWFVKKSRTNKCFQQEPFLHSLPFSLPSFAVTEIFSTEEHLVICATSQALQAPCSACQQIS